MNVEIEKEITVTLSLTVEEARWLHNICQNDVTEQENAAQKQIREGFFNILHNLEEL